MTRYFEPDLSSDLSNPFARDETGKLVRRTYWLDLTDQSVVLAMTVGVGAALTNEQKRTHLADIKREHVVDDVIVVEILPPEEG